MQQNELQLWLNQNLTGQMEVSKWASSLKNVQCARQSALVSNIIIVHLKD